VLYCPAKMNDKMHVEKMENRKGSEGLEAGFAAEDAGEKATSRVLFKMDIRYVTASRASKYGV
jgi:hypothetical protein